MAFSTISNDKEAGATKKPYFEDQAASSGCKFCGLDKIKIVDQTIDEVDSNLF